MDTPLHMYCNYHYLLHSTLHSIDTCQSSTSLPSLRLRQSQTAFVIKASHTLKMTTTGVTAMHSREHDENEGGEEEEEDPMPIELPGLDMLDDDKGCCSSCWNVFSSVISLVLYTIEYFVAIWVSYTYASNHMYVPFGLSLGYLALPHVILVTISLTWYYNLDRFHRKRKDSDPHNLEFLEYRKKFSPAAVIFHILLLGMVYR